MKNSMILAGACLLALAFTIAECDVSCNDASNPTSELTMCITQFGTDPTSVCTDACRELLQKYFEMCLTGDQDLNTVCGGSQVCTDFLDTSSDLFTCNANLATNPDSACSSDCREALEEYIEDCLDGATADTFNDSLDRACGDVEGDATTVGATLISTVSALMVAVSAALY